MQMPLLLMSAKDDEMLSLEGSSHSLLQVDHSRQTPSPQGIHRSMDLTLLDLCSMWL